MHFVAHLLHNGSGVLPLADFGMRFLGHLLRNKFSDFAPGLAVHVDGVTLDVTTIAPCY